MRVLITGGGGFIGSHLVDSQLAQGHLVRAVDLHVEGLQHQRAHPRLEIIEGDICDNELLPRLIGEVDVVYHLASAHLDVTLSNDDYHRVNVDATINLLQEAARSNVARFVHCSSVGVMGDIKNPPADEGTPCRPSNIYEETKLKGELVAREFAAGNSLHLVIVRPAWVYGPRCPRTSKLLSAIARGRFVIFGSGRTMRHPLYISDAVRGLETCAVADVPAGELFIIAGEHAVTVRELVATVAEVQGVAPPSIRLPLAVGYLAAYTSLFAFGALGRRPPFSPRTLDFFTKNNAYDTRKAQRDLGFRPAVDLRTGLCETVRQNSAARTVL